MSTQWPTHTVADQELVATSSLIKPPIPASLPDAGVTYKQHFAVPRGFVLAAPFLFLENQR